MSAAPMRPPGTVAQTLLQPAEPSRRDYQESSLRGRGSPTNGRTHPRPSHRRRRFLILEQSERHPYRKGPGEVVLGLGSNKARSLDAAVFPCHDEDCSDLLHDRRRVVEKDRLSWHSP